MSDKVKQPAVRFVGHTNDWEQRKLGEVCGSLEYGLNAAAKEYDGENKYIRITDIDDNTRLFLTSDLTSPDTNLKDAARYRLEAGDIVFARTGASVGKSYIYKRSDGTVYYAGFLIRAKVKQEYSADFVFQNTLSQNYEKYILITSQRSGQPGVNAQEYAEYTFSVPEYEEQKKIGTFLTSLDRLITLHQRKYDKLVNVKKSLIDKMFPKKGAVVPEVRFAGFTDAWEQRKFANLAETRRGLTYSPSDIRESGVRVLRSSNIAEDQFVHGEEDVFVQADAVNIPYAQEGDILITSANGSTRLVGKHTIIKGLPKHSAVPGGFMLLATAKHPEFVNALMSAPWYTKFISLYVAGGNGAIGNLNKNDLDEQIVLIPSDAEQIAIGQYFKSIDRLITLHQRKLEKLENIKKAFLEKIFI